MDPDGVRAAGRREGEAPAAVGEAEIQRVPASVRAVEACDLVVAEHQTQHLEPGGVGDRVVLSGLLDKERGGGELLLLVFQPDDVRLLLRAEVSRVPQLLIGQHVEALQGDGHALLVHCHADAAAEQVPVRGGDAPPIQGFFRRAPEADPAHGAVGPFQTVVHQLEVPDIRGDLLLVHSADCELQMRLLLAEHAQVDLVCDEAVAAVLGVFVIGEFSVHTLVRIVQCLPVEALRDPLELLTAQLERDEAVADAVDHAVVEEIRDTGLADAHGYEAVRPLHQEERPARAVRDGQRVSVRSFVRPLGVVVGIAGVGHHIAEAALGGASELVGDDIALRLREEVPVELEGAAGVYVAAQIVIFVFRAPPRQPADARRLVKASLVRRRDRLPQRRELVLFAQLVHLVGHLPRCHAVRAVGVGEGESLLRVEGIVPVLVVVGQPLAQRLSLGAVAQSLHGEHADAEKAPGAQAAKADQPRREGRPHEQRREDRRDQQRPSQASRPPGLSAPRPVAQAAASLLQQLVRRVVEGKEQRFVIQHSPSSFK